MGTILSATAGFCLWVALWSLNVKAIDGFMITLLIVIVALAMRMLLPHIPSNRRQ
ncbi:MAG TPA: hypothetical protein VNT22_07900 [Baekduia sp.]|nr:hypothetical protein [Baekduia sp.]